MPKLRPKRYKTVFPVAGELLVFNTDTDGLPYDKNAVRVDSVMLSVACFTDTLTVRVEARTLQLIWLSAVHVTAPASLPDSMMRKPVLNRPQPDPNKLTKLDPEVGKGETVDVTEEIIDSVTMPVELCAGRLKGTVATKVSCRSMMAERLHDNAVPLFQSDDWHMENPARTKGEESAVANA